MTIKAYIYAEDGAFLGYMAYTGLPPEVLELNGRYFQNTHGENEEELGEMAFAYHEIIPENELGLDVIEICIGCGRNASLFWWKCCPEHLSIDSPDVFCQSCVERLHPGEEEFSRS